MTEERAKKVLQEQIDKYGQEYDAEGIEALEMAIKALEQQPHKAEFVPSRDGYEGHVTCSNCFKIYDWDSEAQYFNYCPNCGANMGVQYETDN